MNDFSHPRAWHEERPQRVVLLFSDVKKADHLLIAFISSAGRAPLVQDLHRQTQLCYEVFLCKSTDNVRRKMIFCVLANSFMNIVPDRSNAVTTKYLSATERIIFPDFSKSSGQWALCALSFPFSFPPLHYDMHSTWTDRQLSGSPHTFPGSILHTLPMDNQHANPFKPKLGQARIHLWMWCRRMRRGKQHLLSDARLCMKGSLLDGFPFMNWDSLPTFDHQLHSRKWHRGDGKREMVRPLTLCVFHQLDRSVYNHTTARRWRGTKDRVPASNHP